MDNIAASPVKITNSLIRPWLIALLVGLLIGFFATRYFPAPAAERIAPVDYSARMQACEDRSMKFLGKATADVVLQSQIGGHCATQVSLEASLNDFNLRRLTYISQQFETIVLMWMVVVITFSGVLLAGVQLMAAYQLASVGKGSIDNASELSFKSSELSVKSSYVGLLILAASFAFFFVFVEIVYPVNAERKSRSSGEPSLPLLTSKPGVIGAPPLHAGSSASEAGSDGVATPKATDKAAP
ncbi:hypothetical protein ACW9YQ_25075 (plasmid) [Paraburkholderia strydomiana]